MFNKFLPSLGLARVCQINVNSGIVCPCISLIAWNTQIFQVHVNLTR